MGLLANRLKWRSGRRRKRWTRKAKPIVGRKMWAMSLVPTCPHWRAESRCCMTEVDSPSRPFPMICGITFRCLTRPVTRPEDERVEHGSRSPCVSDMGVTDSRRVVGLPRFDIASLELTGSPWAFEDARGFRSGQECVRTCAVRDPPSISSEQMYCYEGYAI